MAEVIRLEKKEILSKKDIELLMDAIQKPVERPKRKQKPYDSGKKKGQTFRTQIRTRLVREMVHV